jgi:hypothetical protein
MKIDHLSCCGVVELQGVGYAEHLEEELRYQMRHDAELYSTQKPLKPHYAVVIFTYASNTGRYRPDEGGCNFQYGDELKELIEKLKLGEVKKVTTAQNPNSLNNITLYTWTLNKPAVIKWMGSGKGKKGYDG